MFVAFNTMNKMESYYLLANSTENEFSQIKIDTKICVCCSSQNPVFIKIKTCKHTTFLKSINKLKVELHDALVCVVCHNMLKKIEEFQNMVVETFALLFDKTETPKIIKQHKLHRSPLELTDLTQPDLEIEPATQVDFEIKPEVVEFEVPDEHTDLDTEFKVEHDNCDNDFLSIVSLPEKKSQKINQVNKYEGKIRVVTLTLEELNEEREAMAKQTKYLRLPYKCEDCIIAFDHEITWKTHLEQRHKMHKNSYQCNICKSVLNFKSSYNEHVKRHLRRFECVECGKRYNHTPSAIQHYDEKHLPAGSCLQPGYTCRECGFTTTVNRTYRYHMEKHKLKQYCNVCNKPFVNSNSLKNHMYTVHKQSPREYRCEPCAKTYRAKSGLTGHLRSVHADAPRAYCAPCRTHYMTYQGLHAHLRTHSKHISDSDKRFICDDCGAKFVKKSSLQIHINWEHLKINIHRCVNCSKMYKTASDLRRHVNFVHDKQRPPRNKICHFCGRGFTTQTILQSHLRTHTGERPLECQHCRATFAHSGALYTHMKLKHAGISK